MKNGCGIVEINGRKFFQKNFSAVDLRFPEIINNHLFASEVLKQINIMHPKIDIHLSKNNTIVMDYLSFPTLAEYYNRGNTSERLNLLYNVLDLDKRFYTFGANSMGEVIQHNDMNALNVLYDASTKDIYFVDYADIGYSFKGRDFASILLDPQIRLDLNEMFLIVQYIKDTLTFDEIKHAVVLEKQRKYDSLMRMSVNVDISYKCLAKIVLAQFAIFSKLSV